MALARTRGGIGIPASQPGRAVILNTGPGTMCRADFLVALRAELVTSTSRLVVE